MLLGTFKGGAELFVSGLNLNPTWDKLHLKAWRYLFTGVMSDGTSNPHDYFIWYKNSLFIVLVQGGLTLLLSSMVAYGLSKYRFKGQNAMFLCVLLVMMIPLEILMLPMYSQINTMGLRDNYAGVMLPFLVSMSAVFFFRQFLEGIPIDLARRRPRGAAAPSTASSSASSCPSCCRRTPPWRSWSAWARGTACSGRCWSSRT